MEGFVNGNRREKGRSMNLKDFNNLPDLLFHAAPQCVEDAIIKEGLKSPWGEIYMTTDQQHCLRFMGSRLLAHMHGVKEIEVKGEMVSFPDVVQHDYIPVFGITKARLNHKLLRFSDDHDPAFYGKDVISLVYDADVIPPQWLSKHVGHWA